MNETLKNYLPLIVSCPLFAKLTDSELDEALDILNAEISFREKGEYLFHPHSEMTRFGLVLEGTVLVCTDDIDGNRMIMSAVSPGCTFGESLCWLGVKDSPVYIYASIHSVILLLDPSGLGAETDCANRMYAVLRSRFTSMLATRNLSMNLRIQVLSKLSLREKLIAYFSELAASCGSRTIILPMNREDTAAYIGTDRSALSRELSRMKADGIIDYYRNTVRIIGK